MNVARPALAAALLLSACAPQRPHQPPPLAGAAIGGPFALTDQNGRVMTDRSFAGRYRIMYFGYTFCPDVCPTDLGKLAAGLKLVEAHEPSLGARIVPIFVTVDPARDTPAVLKPYVAAFHPRMEGLTGTPDAIARVAKEWAVYYKKGDAAPGGGYLMQHSTMAYLMGPNDQPLALLPQDGTPQQIADEIERWAS